MSASRALWESRLPVEIGYWEGWIQSRGYQFPDEFRARTTPGAPLQDNFRVLIDAPYGGRVKILDVGAGPATILGTEWYGRELEITAIDPLASTYAYLLWRYGHTVPVVTTQGNGEDLLDWPAATFDFAHSRNALDHTYDPLRCIRGMVHVVKPRAFVYMLHHIKTADFEQRIGLHQWNFWLEGGAYWLETAGAPRINATESLADVAEMTARTVGDDIEVVWRKR